MWEMKQLIALKKYPNIWHHNPYYKKEYWETGRYVWKRAHSCYNGKIGIERRGRGAEREREREAAAAKRFRSE